MKKLFLGMLFAAAAGTASAQTETTTQSSSTTTQSNSSTMTRTSQDSSRFWYYPNANVYMNDATGDYWYWDQPNNKWLSSKPLPGNYSTADTTGRFEVYYRGNDVWKDNKTHKMKVKPGKTKTKTSN